MKKNYVPHEPYRREKRKVYFQYMGTFFSIDCDAYPALCEAFEAGCLDFSKHGATKLTRYPSGYSRTEVPEIGQDIDRQLCAY